LTLHTSLSDGVALVKPKQKPTASTLTYALDTAVVVMDRMTTA